VRSIVVTKVDLRLHSFVSIRVCNGGPRAVHGESARREVERTKPPLPKKADVRQLHRHALHGYPSRRRAQTAQHCPLSASSASAKTTACTRACYGRWAQVCDAATRGAADRKLPPSRRAVSPRRRGAGGPLRAPRGAVSEALARQILEHEPELRANAAPLVRIPGPDARSLAAPSKRAIGWIEDALAPLRRLVLAIRATLGIEALVWLTDIGGLSREEAVEIMRSSARTPARAAIAEATPDR
jgi:hypothetical protein